jgi:hypothetical protein
MQFMIIVKATKDSEAGVLLDGSGLQASSKGWKVKPEEIACDQPPKGSVMPGPNGRDKDRRKAQKVMQAMMQMEKLDIKGLEAAYG